MTSILLKTGEVVPVEQFMEKKAIAVDQNQPACENAALVSTQRVDVGAAPLPEPLDLPAQRSTARSAELPRLADESHSAPDLADPAATAVVATDLSSQNCTGMPESPLRRVASDESSSPMQLAAHHQPVAVVGTFSQPFPQRDGSTLATRKKKEEMYCC